MELVRNGGVGAVQKREVLMAIADNDKHHSNRLRSLKPPRSAPGRDRG
jgi:hypothetical protein